MNIIVHNTVLELKNVEWSPYFNGLFSSGIGYDKDCHGNAVFDDYSLEYMICYIEYCNTGYINRETFSYVLFDYMGHDCSWYEYESYLVLRLQHEWREKYGGYVPYSAPYSHDHELIEAMNKLFFDVEYIYAGLAEGRTITYKIIVFCPSNECSNKITFDGRIYLLKYVDDMDPIDYIMKHRLDCYYNGMYYGNSDIKMSVKYLNAYYLDHINLNLDCPKTIILNESQKRYINNLMSISNLSSVIYSDKSNVVTFILFKYLGSILTCKNIENRKYCDMYEMLEDIQI